eukprot:CAMPEP_0173415284 /NCGR_PEP_ID=MMETSP1356-20130122/84777_1 /TAXON_ID=77927 ORGANISM="Hemiselmis virescens, Strain PCC157" /NCGR_SAMPLE_ID=MMETSP1356 /ASSEMBLY_ACC=CAM_ASM_000847 /LENGTH=53 /DNA_ID=CAMNT_0014377521 /DNA_START=1487 /DNA_END=1644 /DNA_ORIENTATION=+
MCGCHIIRSIVNRGQDRWMGKEEALEEAEGMCRGAVVVDRWMGEEEALEEAEG